MKLSSHNTEVIDPGWLFRNPPSLYSCKMQASNMKSMSVAKGQPTRGVIRICSGSYLFSALADSSDMSDDVGLTLRIDENFRRPTHCQQEKALYAMLNPPNTCIDSNALSNFASTSNNIGDNQHSTDDSLVLNLGKDFFQAFLQPTPLTPVQSPSQDNELNHRTSCKSSWFERQTSLSIALEVLGEPVTTSPAEGCYPPTPSSESEEEQYLQYPTPSYVQHFAPMPRQLSRTRTASDHTDYVSSEFFLDNSRIRAFSAENSDFGPEFYLADTEGDTGSSDKEIQGETSSVVETSTCSSPITTTVTSGSEENEHATSSLASLPSFIRAACENPAPPDVEESLDMVEMLKDFLEETDSLQKANAERTSKLRKAVAADHTYSAKYRTTVKKRDAAVSTCTKDGTKEQSAGTSQTTAKIIVDLTEEESCTSPTTPTLCKSSSYIRKRSQNNRACRESRRKRKAERDEAEKKVKFLAQDNEDMKKKIQALEIEVKETRAQLISRMVNR